MRKSKWNKQVQKKGVDQISGQAPEINEWGSVQYWGALSFYKSYFLIRKDLEIEDALEVLGCKFQFSELHRFHQVKEAFSEHFENRKKTVPSLSSEVDKDIEDLKSVSDLDGLFCFVRKRAWDLWTAAKYARSYFKGLEMTAPKAPGIGPIGNQIAQSDNYETGLVCAMLIEYGLIKNDASFANFDT